MTPENDPVSNYEHTMQAIGYVPRREATQDDYDRIGFMSGLEVHQQLKTDEKLFAGVLPEFTRMMMPMMRK